ncbi:hypothetical protein F2Q70_00039945 [Brassica cretica]|uniref:Transmembrane 9 superfamily member n=1 Tax=Brassica cretica TaxID=69181 RepID=A0A8S9K8Z2_BRACR|nr:hypothetical protein F2Q70_00039945 [Brassica cretica]
MYTSIPAESESSIPLGDQSSRTMRVERRGHRARFQSRSLQPPSVVSLMGGLLPFGSNVYYVYGFMLLVFVILVIVTVCVTIVGTYFLLNAENYHWQWTSFCPAASTAVSVYLYSFYYYYYYVKSKMSGFFQTSFYFGYTTMFCIGLGILCGAVGFLGSNLFVRRIY